MKPQTIGRVLGIGLRVAGRVAGQRITSQPSSNPPAAGQHPANTPVTVAGVGGPGTQTAAHPPVTVRAGRATRNLGRGLGGFIRPFGRVGGILWLEVTGVFFLLPVVVFTPTVWHARASWAHGPDHRTFWVSSVVVVVFLYLGVSSFWRARRR
jgi:hypothetical protein